ATAVSVRPGPSGSHTTTTDWDPMKVDVLELLAEARRLRHENERLRHELEVMYGGAFDSLGTPPVVSCPHGPERHGPEAGCIECRCTSTTGHETDHQVGKESMKVDVLATSIFRSWTLEDAYGFDVYAECDLDGEVPSDADALAEF